jgi:hypothetical protein
MSYCGKNLKAKETILEKMSKVLEKAPARAIP